MGLSECCGEFWIGIGGQPRRGDFSSLAEVHHLPTGGVDGHGSLSVDRNAPFTVEFAPPLDALVDDEPGRVATLPPVWHDTMWNTFILK